MKQILGIGFVVLLVLGFYWYGTSAGIWGEDGAPDISEWVMYQNSEFGFELLHPEDWGVHVATNNVLGPIFNVYPKEVQDAPPFTHHSDVPNVSVFPNGIPTEGVFGVSTTSTVSLSEDFRFAVDFLLENGDVWATAAGSEMPPSSWLPSGFVWARAPIKNLTTQCMRDGVEISESECDPLTGDKIVRRGEVDKGLRAIEEVILSSIRFIESDGQMGGTDGVVDDLIHVLEPIAGDIVRSPLMVSGEARGTWYFEATFPLTLIDTEGNVIAQSYATADGDWMTEDFVPFTGEIVFSAQDELGSPAQALLIFGKSNPSGLPEHDAAIGVPVELLFE
jgi:hypothetical protein